MSNFFILESARRLLLILLPSFRRRLWPRSVAPYDPARSTKLIWLYRMVRRLVWVLISSIQGLFRKQCGIARWFCLIWYRQSFLSSHQILNIEQYLLHKRLCETTNYQCKLLHFYCPLLKDFAYLGPISHLRSRCRFRDNWLALWSSVCLCLGEMMTSFKKTSLLLFDKSANIRLL